MGDEGGIARRFWIKFKNDSLFAIYTPFVVSLASGDLDSQSFRHFISQDLYFLQAFDRAHEMAEECADDDEDKAAIRKLRRLVKDELKNRDSAAREWGFELLRSTSDKATIRYTDFLLATASGKVEGEKSIGKIATPFEKTKLAAYALGAMAPHMRFYAYICKEILTLLVSDKSNHMYKKWIDSYENFEAAALQTEDLLDKLSISLTGEELEVIERLYYKAVKLEVEFYSAQPILQQTIVPLSPVDDPEEHSLTIFCDFDMTCTAVDSSALLAEIAIITAPKTDLNETQLARFSSGDLKNSWDLLSRKYAKEYEHCMESILASETAPHFNYESLRKALEQLSDFEKRANSRVVESEVLKGLNSEDIKRAGQSLILQDGCRGFFQKIVNCKDLKANVHVISYCWCSDLIRSAFSSGGLDVLKVHSNELAYNESISTGEIVKKVESPMEKLKVFNDILKGNSDDPKHLTIYIGGSVGDLLCLLEADIGIVIGSGPSLRKLGEQFGLSFMPLFPGLVKKQRELTKTGASHWKGFSGVLYTASSWSEVHASIFGSSKTLP